MRFFTFYLLVFVLVSVSFGQVQAPLIFQEKWGLSPIGSSFQLPVFKNNKKRIDVITFNPWPLRTLEEKRLKFKFVSAESVGNNCLHLNINNGEVLVFTEIAENKIHYQRSSEKRGITEDLTYTVPTQILRQKAILAMHKKNNYRANYIKITRKALPLNRYVITGVNKKGKQIVNQTFRLLHGLIVGVYAEEFLTICRKPIQSNKDESLIPLQNSFFDLVVITLVPVGDGFYYQGLGYLPNFSPVSFGGKTLDEIVAQIYYGIATQEKNKQDVWIRVVDSKRKVGAICGKIMRKEIISFTGPKKLYALFFDIYEEKWYRYGFNPLAQMKWAVSGENVSCKISRRSIFFNSSTSKITIK